MCPNNNSKKKIIRSVKKRTNLNRLFWFVLYQKVNEVYNFENKTELSNYDNNYEEQRISLNLKKSIYKLFTSDSSNVEFDNHQLLLDLI